MPNPLLSFCRSPYFLVTFAMFLSASNLIVGRAVGPRVWDSHETLALMRSLTGPAS